IRNLPPFSEIKNLPSGNAAMLHGFSSAFVTTAVLKGVVVFAAAIRVCPSKAGLYCGLFAGTVSTGGKLPGLLEDLVDEHAIRHRLDAAANNNFFMPKYFRCEVMFARMVLKL